MRRLAFGGRARRSSLLFLTTIPVFVVYRLAGSCAEPGSECAPACPHERDLLLALAILGGLRLQHHPVLQLSIDLYFEVAGTLVGRSPPSLLRASKRATESLKPSCRLRRRRSVRAARRPVSRPSARRGAPARPRSSCARARPSLSTAASSLDAAQDEYRYDRRTLPGVARRGGKVRLAAAACSEGNLEIVGHRPAGGKP